ncbi:MAG: hypothetical protein AAGK77_02615, partial [Pseudomonadota bacterium]
GGIDKHFLSHKSPLRARDRPAPGGAAVLGACLVCAKGDAPQIRPEGPSAGFNTDLTRVIAVLLRHTRKIRGVRSYAAPNLSSRQQLVAISGPIGLSKAAGPCPDQSTAKLTWNGAFGHQRSIPLDKSKRLQMTMVNQRERLVREMFRVRNI